MNEGHDHNLPFSIGRVGLSVLVLGASCGVVVMTWPLLASLVPWRVVSAARPVDLGHGVTFVVEKVKGPVEAELQFVVFDIRECALRVIGQPGKKDALPLNEAAKAAGAVASCNGGYFEVPTFEPSGLQISGGKRSGELVHNPLASCVVVRAGTTEMIKVADFRDNPAITDFVQCHPVYVIDGKPVNLGNGPRAQRTFVLTDGAGRWVIGVCSAIGLQDMADLLATPGVMGNVKVVRAMNLDGGPSTALWCRDTSGAEHYTKESWRVKNLLAVVPRK